MNLGTLTARHARCMPDRLAVVFGDKRLTWREFNQRVNRLANAFLGLGIAKGEKIATILPNSLELLETYWAVAKMGAVVVPLSPLTRRRGLISMLNNSDSVCVITDSAFVEHLNAVRSDLNILADRFLVTDAADLAGYRHYAALTSAAGADEPRRVEIADSDLFNIMYTSGTTGDPKGIVHTHYVRGMYCSLMASAYRMTPESVVLHSGAIVFNGAFVTLMPSFFLGATYVLEKQFNAESFVEVVRRERVTHTMMVPSQIVSLLHTPSFSVEALESLEMILSLGAPLHQEHKDELCRRLPGRLYELYGLTEGFVTILDKNDVAAKPSSVGVTPPFFEMRIVNEQGRDVPPGEVGEIVGRGPILMPGYYKRPDLTANAIVDGWLYSGDMGYVDDDGYLYLVDRKKDLIISGGINVYPRDIEEIAVQHPAVREAAVFGIPHDRWGETPLAAVILHEPGSATAEELRDWINQRIEARYQRVDAVVVVDDFPRSTAGKTLKRVMREPYWAERGTKI
ncbi:MAG: AMP-binding protein [Desulfomonile tiedjei]|nr:AMP-binding protein [Desulfomonile tiedjei]